MNYESQEEHDHYEGAMEQSVPQEEPTHNTREAELKHSLHTSLVAAVEGIDEYQEAYDHDGHRYEIPRSKSLDWENFLEIPEDDERSWDVPEWAERIDGIAVRSIKEQVLTIINSIFKE